MFVFAFIREITDLEPDFTVSHLSRKSLQVITFDVETTPRFQIKTPTMPIAGEDSVTYHSSR